ncbi:MAG: hypothetical protein JNL70_15545 [Saprospiraceae bacterium]|nr:hypothetical protein [Saprospiraceae bacterium]
MKKIIVFLLVTLSSISLLQAQLDRSKLSTPTVNTTPSGLKVEVRINKSNMIIRELSNPVSMFTFKLFTPTFSPKMNNPQSLSNDCIYHEISGFNVVCKNNVSMIVNGDIVYNFILTGLSTEMLYGVDVIPSTYAFKPNIGYVLTKTGQASSGFCNNSTVNGQTLKIYISAVNPPK